MKSARFKKHHCMKQIRNHRKQKTQQDQLTEAKAIDTI